jgi:hypothetical protein
MAWSSFLIWRAVRRLRGEVSPFALRFKRLTGLTWIRGRLHALGSRFQLFLRRETAGWAHDPVLGPIGNLIVGDVDNPFQQRARRARVYDRERVIGRVQWAGWAAAVFFFFLVAVCEERQLGRDEAGMTFLGFTWLGIALLTAILAGTSLVGDRRRGFLEQVLVTPLTGREVIDGTLLAVWEHMRRVALLPVLLGVVFCFTGACSVVGVICSLITASLSCALVALCGIGCSLPAKTLPGAMAATMIFPLTITIATALLIPEFRSEHGPVLWVCTILLLLITLVWVRRRVNAALVCAYVLATHLALVCLATCWTYDGNEDALPAIAMNPAFWTVALLQEKLTYIWPRETGPWGLALVLYWLALIANFFWARWWLIRNFDRLAGRAEQPESKPAACISVEEREPVPAGAVVNS